MKKVLHSVDATGTTEFTWLHVLYFFSITNHSYPRFKFFPSVFLQSSLQLQFATTLFLKNDEHGINSLIQKNFL